MYALKDAEIDFMRFIYFNLSGIISTLAKRKDLGIVFVNFVSATIPVLGVVSFANYQKTFT